MKAPSGLLCLRLLNHNMSCVLNRSSIALLVWSESFRIIQTYLNSCPYQMMSQLVLRRVLFEKKRQYFEGVISLPCLSRSKGISRRPLKHTLRSYDTPLHSILFPQERSKKRGCDEYHLVFHRIHPLNTVASPEQGLMESRWPCQFRIRRIKHWKISPA